MEPVLERSGLEWPHCAVFAVNVTDKGLFKNYITPEGGRAGSVRLCYDVLQGGGGINQLLHNKINAA